MGTGGSLESFFNLHWKINKRLFVDENHCCKCEQVGFLQIVSQKVEFHNSNLNSLFDKPWQLDGGRPYGYASFYNMQFLGFDIPSGGNPCKIPVIGMQDFPGVPIKVWSPLGTFKNAHLTQEFETCVVCLSGSEGPQISATPYYGGTDYNLASFTTYGCIKWSHEFRVSPTGVVTSVKRKLNGNPIVAGWFIGAPGSNAPSATFKNVIESSYHSTWAWPAM